MRFSANQIESGAGQTVLQCRQKSLQPTPRSNERHKGMQTGTGQVLDGSGRGLSTASRPADRAQANQGVGKVPKPIPVCLWDTPARKPVKVLSRWPAGKTQSEIKLLIQENSKLQDLIVYTDGCHQKPVRVGLQCQLMCHYHPWRQWGLIRSQPPAWQWRWKQSPMPSAGLPQKVIVRPHMSPSSQMQWAC